MLIVRHFVLEVTIGTSPLDAFEKTAWKRLSISKGRYLQIHGMANARNEFMRTSYTLSSHFADFFFLNTSFWGEFSFKIGEKKHTFWRGEWGRISAPKTAEKNTEYWCIFLKNWNILTDLCL